MRRVRGFKFSKYIERKFRKNTILDQVEDLDRELSELAEFMISTRRENLIIATATWNPPSMGAGGAQSTTVEVPGAQPGDFALASFDQLGGLTFAISAAVAKESEVEVVLENRTGGTQDLPAGNVWVRVWRNNRQVTQELVE